MDQWLLDFVQKWDGYGMIIYVLITTVISALLAFLIGFERHRKGEEAGLKTHVLVAIGSSVLMTISIWAIRIADHQEINYDPSRIAAGIVTGIGFLGAGIIVKDRFSIRGISSAATLWVCSAIGLACGAGFVIEAILVTAIVMLFLYLLDFVLHYFDKKSPALKVVAKSDYALVKRVGDLAFDTGIILKNVHIDKMEDKQLIATVLFAFKTDPSLLEYLKVQLEKETEIISVTTDNAGK